MKAFKLFYSYHELLQFDKLFSSSTKFKCWLTRESFQFISRLESFSSSSGNGLIKSSDPHSISTTSQTLNELCSRWYEGECKTRSETWRWALENHLCFRMIVHFTVRSPRKVKILNEKTFRGERKMRGKTSTGEVI